MAIAAEASTCRTVLLGADGEVIGTSGGAPPAWVGQKLEACADAPAALRTAARALVDTVRTGHGPTATAEVESGDAAGRFLVIATQAIGLHKSTTDVRALFAYTTKALGGQARAIDAELRILTDEGVPATVFVDPEKIAWVVTSLVGNALRHVKHGTRHLPGGTIEVSARCDASRRELTIVVADDGPGIPPDVFRRLFHREPGAPHAVGLALTVARDVITAHGGTLDVTTSTDALDSGTKVTIRLPIA